MNHKKLCEKLMELDLEFAKTTERLGLEGWVGYFDEDGAMIPAQGEVIRGKAAIRQAMSASFSKPGYSLKWAPEYAEVSQDGSLGYTYGSYVRTLANETGEVSEGRGRYTSIWKRQEDGVYRIIMDMGN